MWKRLFGKREDEPTAARQEGDVHALDRPGDPRGGVAGGGGGRHPSRWAGKGRLGPATAGLWRGAPAGGFRFAGWGVLLAWTWLAFPFFRYGGGLAGASEASLAKGGWGWWVS